TGRAARPVRGWRRRGRRGRFRAGCHGRPSADPAMLVGGLFGPGSGPHPRIPGVPMNTNRFDLTDRVAVVTGASSGIGTHLAEVLHDAGATVALVARRRERLEEIADGREHMVAFPADLSDPSQRESLIAEVLERLGRI